MSDHTIERPKRIYDWVKPERKLFITRRIYKPLEAEKDLPINMDLRPLCPPIVDQGQLGSCTANALSGAWGFLELQAIVNKTPDNEEFDPTTFIGASRLFIYYTEREIEGDVRFDHGANLSSGIKALSVTGCCDEKVWSYDISRFRTQPNAAAYTEAYGHKISDYGQLNSLYAIKDCIASGFPVVFGFTVFANFESEEVENTGVLGMPAGRQEGGHAVMIVGYDDVSKTVLVRNSWGTDWGMKGYFTMPYDYVSNPNWCDEFYTVRK